MLSKLQYDEATGVFLFSDGTPVVSYLAGGNKKGGEYLVIRVGKGLHYAHRLAFYCKNGRWPDHHIDHINGNKTDNRWVNLREATMAQNKANEGVRASNTSGWKGVSWHKAAKKWRAYIGGTGEHLGLFDCPAAAHLAYLTEASRRYGEFARGV